MNYKYTYESPLGTMIMLGTLSYLTDLFLSMKIMHQVMMMRSI